MGADRAELLPFTVSERGLLPGRESFISANLFIGEKAVPDPEDASQRLRLLLYRVRHSSSAAAPVLLFPSGVAVSRMSLRVELSDVLITQVRARIASLPDDRYEIFPADHNVNMGFHFPDPWGETTRLLLQLEACLPLTQPPVNHNKVSSRRRDRFDLRELHVDSFEGMRTTAGRRTTVWRHFLNLGRSVRWTAVVPFDPQVVDRLLPAAYSPGYLDAVFSTVGWTIPVLLIPTPGREPGRVHALKLRTTHLVHGEYGKRGDLLAVVNSMT